MKSIGRYSKNEKCESLETITQSARNCAGPGNLKPAPEGEITVLLDLLVARVDHLGEVLDRLSGRLSPVLLPAAAESRAEADHPGAITPVGNVIAGQVARIEYMIDSVVSTTGALAL